MECQSSNQQAELSDALRRSAAELQKAEQSRAELHAKNATLTDKLLRARHEHENHQREVFSIQDWQRGTLNALAQKSPSLHREQRSSCIHLSLAALKFTVGKSARRHVRFALEAAISYIAISAIFSAVSMTSQARANAAILQFQASHTARFPYAPWHTNEQCSCIAVCIAL